MCREREFVCQIYPFKTHNFQSISLPLPMVLTSDHINNFCFDVFPSGEEKFITFSEAQRAKYPPWSKICKLIKVNFFFFFLPASILSYYRTVKISRNVGLVRETDGKFVTQFKQLFVSLNEIGEIVAWKLTNSTALSEVEDLLIDLKKRNLVKGKTVELVCVDDCCHVRNTYGIWNNISWSRRQT